jgi:monoamine oxidase
LSRGTAWYDQALSETVLESIDFEYDENIPSQWWCILGGSTQLVQHMSQTLKNQPQTDMRVTRIDWDQTDDVMKVYTNGSTTSSTPYTAVFNSTTLGTLKMMDTSRAGLSYGIKQAMRSLAYGPSAKVGLVFSEAWWKTQLKNPIQLGGQGHSDLNIRTCVYPSYNILTPTGDHVLLCTYTWQADAERIGSLMCCTAEPTTLDHASTVKDEAKLIDLILWDLARMHAAPGEDVGTLYNMISGYHKGQDHFAHDWTHDPNTAGAFAFFRPEQFSSMWPRLTAPSNNFVVIGEAASPHHAWVVGALESAVVGVYQWLKSNESRTGYTAALNVLLNGVQGQPMPPFCGLPDYIDQSVADWNGLIATVQKEQTLQQARTEGKA